MSDRITHIGLISDTHGLLREAAVEALRGSDLIIHAGDIGRPEVLTELERLAPVIAIRGNIDTDVWATELPPTAIVDAGQARIYVIHNVLDLEIDPKAAGIDIVVSGHSHKPGRTDRDGVLYINPGSAGPRRFRLPVTVARLDLGKTPWTVEFVDVSRDSGEEA